MRQFNSLFARFSVVIVVFAFAAVSLVGCSQGAKWQSIRVADGTEVRWSPAVPEIGDLVRVEATVPGALTGTIPAGSTVGKTDDPSASASANGASPAGDALSPVTAPSVKSPSAAMPTPVSVEYLANGTRYVWSFRATSAGDWSFVSGDRTEKLWTTATVVGNATELKKLDASGLWKGTLKKAPPAQPAPKGVSPAAGNSASPQIIPQSPSAGQPAVPGQSAPQTQPAPASPAAPGNALPVPAPKAVTL